MNQHTDGVRIYQIKPPEALIEVGDEFRAPRGWNPCPKWTVGLPVGKMMVRRTTAEEAKKTDENPAFNQDADMLRQACENASELRRANMDACVDLDEDRLREATPNMIAVPLSMMETHARLLRNAARMIANHFYSLSVELHRTAGEMEAACANAKGETVSQPTPT